MPRQSISTEVKPPVTLVVGIRTPQNKALHFESYIEEFKSLIKTNEVIYEDLLIIKLREVDPSYFFTKGKLKELTVFCRQNNIERIFISESLSPKQERNISEAVECDIVDRTGLILEIFHKAAHSAEGKTQVEIAILQYKKTRLAGKGIHMSQQTGALGVRSGPGETAKELEVRHINTEILKLKRKLQRIEQARSTQRKRRLGMNIPQLCFVGYTNAGKSTILNNLTKSDVLAEDKLFATLDTTTRELYIKKEKIGVISDTVGFIQALPHQLVEAFKSTLSELQYAHLLLHVIDLSDPSWQEHIYVVQKLLAELEVDKEVLYVFNKIDKVSDVALLLEDLALYKPYVLVSAQSKEGLQPLTDYLYEWHKINN